MKRKGTNTVAEEVALLVGMRAVHRFLTEACDALLKGVSPTHYPHKELLSEYATGITNQSSRVEKAIMQIPSILLQHPVGLSTHVGQPQACMAVQTV
jgi:hypothetical protein